MCVSGCMSLCNRYFNSMTDVVLCMEETRQGELAEKHYKHHLLVRALLCVRGKRLRGEFEQFDWQ